MCHLRRVRLTSEWWFESPVGRLLRRSLAMVLSTFARGTKAAIALPTSPPPPAALLLPAVSAHPSAARVDPLALLPYHADVTAVAEVAAATTAGPTPTPVPPSATGIGGASLPVAESGTAAVAKGAGSPVAALAEVATAAVHASDMGARTLGRLVVLLVRLRALLEAHRTRGRVAWAEYVRFCGDLDDVVSERWGARQRAAAVRQMLATYSFLVVGGGGSGGGFVGLVPAL